MVDSHWSVTGYIPGASICYTKGTLGKTTDAKRSVWELRNWTACSHSFNHKFCIMSKTSCAELDHLDLSQKGRSICSSETLRNVTAHCSICAGFHTLRGVLIIFKLLHFFKAILSPCFPYVQQCPLVLVLFSACQTPVRNFDFTSPCNSWWLKWSLIEWVWLMLTL